MNENNESIFVGNLSAAASAQDVKSHFESYGVITAGVDLKTNFAFVYVDKTKYDIDDMIVKMQGGTIDGNVITIEKSKCGISAKLKELKRREVQTPTSVLFVVGFGNRAIEGEVRDVFSASYNPKFVEIRTRYCFVGYHTVAEATAVLESLNDKEISGGRILSIEYAQKKPRPSEHSNRDDDNDRYDRRSRERRPSDRRDSREGRGGDYAGLDSTGDYAYRSPGRSSSGGFSSSTGPYGLGSSTAAAIRDREIAEAFIRMREWEAYYFSLLAERDAIDGQRGDVPSYAVARRPAGGDDYRERSGDLSRPQGSGRDLPRDGRRPESRGRADLAGSSRRGSRRSFSRSRSRSQSPSHARPRRDSSGPPSRDRSARPFHAGGASPMQPPNTREVDYDRPRRRTHDDGEDDADMYVTSAVHRSPSLSD